MTETRSNGRSIAKLKNVRGRTIAWAVLWDNSELSVLWLGDDYKPVDIIPPLDLKTLEAAKAVTTDQITDLLEELSAKSDRQASR